MYTEKAKKIFDLIMTTKEPEKGSLRLSPRNGGQATSYSSGKVEILTDRFIFNGDNENPYMFSSEEKQLIKTFYPSIKTVA